MGLVVESAAVMGQCPAPPDPLVLITELANDGTNTFVELHNPGQVAVDLSGWFLCHRFQYTVGGTLDEVLIPAAGTVVVQVSGSELDATHADVLAEWFFPVADFSTGDMGLYESGAFHIPEEMVDFLEWDMPGQGREAEADLACLWDAGDFIPNPLSESTFQLDSDEVEGDSTSSADYTVRSFALNNLRVFPPPPPPTSGDADGDEDIDLHDVAAFQECNFGPEIPPDDECTQNFDFDGDLDVDLVDFAALQVVFTGTRLPIDLTISGPDQVDETATADYSAMVTYTLGPAETLTDGADWSVDPATYATIDTSGMLTTLEVEGDQSATITAAFSFEGMPAIEGTLAITITDQSEAPEPVDGTIVITELAGDGTNTYVELFNTGDFEIDLTDWWLCLNPEFKYEEIAIESCDVLGPGAVLVIQLGGTLDSSLADHAITISPATLDVGDIALYVGQDFSIFSDPDYIREYLQWGAAGQNRENVGADAGLWNEGSYVDASLANGSVQLLESAVDTPLTEIDSLVVTPFSEHSLGVFPNPDPTSDDEPVDDDEQDDGSDDDPPIDDPDSDDESPDDDPSDPSDDDGEAASGPADDDAEDPVAGTDDPQPPVENQVPTTTGNPRPTRGGLCGLFGMINMFALFAGLEMLKLAIGPRGPRHG